LALGLCLLAIPFASEFWQFFAIYVAIGTIAAGSNSVPYMRALASWFDKSRGLAIGIAGSGTGLGFAYVPLVAQFLIDEHGWRWGYYGLALILLCVTLPMVAFVLREAPPERTAVSAPSPAMERGVDLAEAAKMRDFWLLATVFVLVALVLYGLLPHLVPLLTDRGLSPADAALMASAFGLATFAGRVVIGFLIDRFDARRVAFVFFTLSAIGVPALALDLGPTGYMTVAILLGGSLGAEVDMLAYLTSRYFGLRRFAQIFGLLFGVVMLAMAAGPVLFGAVFDAARTYEPMLALGAPLCGAAALLTFALRPYAEKRRGGPVSVT
jgi:MFS family permease